MAMTDLAIVRRSMTARLFSTVTTVLTVAVAVAMLLVLLGMRDSAHRAFLRGAGNMHLLVSAEQDPLTAMLNGIFYARPPRRPIPWAKHQQIAASYPLDFAIPIQQGDSFQGFPVLATTEAFFTKFRPAPDADWTLQEGRYFDGDFQIVVGASAARGTGLGVGDRVVLTHGVADAGREDAAHRHDEFEYEVVGILGPTGTSHDRGIFTNLQSAWIIHAQDRLEREHGQGEHHDHGEHEHHTATADDLTDEDRKITGIYVRAMTRPGSDVSSVLPQVFNALRQDPQITVASPEDETRRLFQIIANVDGIILGMAAVVMVSSGIAIMLALYNSMEQRRRQIAVLRVLGASRGRIFGLILTESAILGILGALAGIALAVAGAWVVAAAMKERLGLVIEPTINPRWVVGVVLAAVALACLAGVVPAVMAYRTAVARNLRPLG